MIYLDYAAHAPADPAVLERFCDMERRFPANPNSVHAAGKAAREEMARVTEQIAALTGASPAEVIFTSGATEANNLAIKGIAQASRHIGKHIISTQLEHSSVGASLSVLQQQGYEIDLLNVNRDGKADLAQLRELLRKDTILVAVCAVDSEIGTVQPVKEIAEIVKQYPDCRLHVDATQAVGKTDLWFDGVDTMSFTAYQEHLVEEQPEIALLVNNAGCGYLGNIGEIDTVSQTRMIDLNLRALTAITNLSVPYMEAGSRILNVSSIASFCPTPRMTVYSATKAYVSAYTIGAAEELKAKGITVTAVCPGPMATEFLAVGHVVDSRPFELLPYCDQVQVAGGALRAARAGQTIYTPRLFYKFYRLLAKLTPAKLMVKLTKT